MPPPTETVPVVSQQQALAGRDVTSSGLAFTPRQEEILIAIASGLADKQIARQLGLSRSTVRTHIDRMYRTLGVRCRAEAVAVWLRSDRALERGSKR
jgi:DNA-binding NarL/FixJ family response regulator